MGEGCRLWAGGPACQLGRPSQPRRGGGSTAFREDGGTWCCEITTAQGWRRFCFWPLGSNEHTSSHCSQRSRLQPLARGLCSLFTCLMLLNERPLCFVSSSALVRGPQSLPGRASIPAQDRPLPRVECGCQGWRGLAEAQGALLLRRQCPRKALLLRWHPNRGLAKCGEPQRKAHACLWACACTSAWQRVWATGRFRGEVGLVPEGRPPGC